MLFATRLHWKKESFRLVLMLQSTIAETALLILGRIVMMATLITRTDVMKTVLLKLLAGRSNVVVFKTR